APARRGGLAGAPVPGVRNRRSYRRRSAAPRPAAARPPRGTVSPARPAPRAGTASGLVPLSWARRYHILSKSESPRSTTGHAAPVRRGTRGGSAGRTECSARCPVDPCGRHTAPAAARVARPAGARSPPPPHLDQADHAEDERTAPEQDRGQFVSAHDSTSRTVPSARSPWKVWSLYTPPTCWNSDV